MLTRDIPAHLSDFEQFVFLGKGWTINSHGSGAGVTINYMGPGAGWYRDNFVFGWRIMPRGV